MWMMQILMYEIRGVGWINFPFDVIIMLTD